MPSMASLPEAQLRELMRVKFCVIALWFLALLRVGLCGDLMGSLSNFVVAMLGTFLLAEDKHLSRCHLCLAQTILGRCCGMPGLSMLMPFLMISGINSIFDLMTVGAIFSTFGRAALQTPLAWIYLAIFFCELFSAVFGYRLLKGLESAQQGDGYARLPGFSGGQGQGSRFGGSGGGGLFGAPAVQSMPGSSGGGGGGGFKAFQGAGQKLGS